MNQFASNSLDEVQRLQSLLPFELQPQVSIIQSISATALITTQKVSKRRFAIQINLVCWQKLRSNQRDLLFWHEVTRIQDRTIAQLTHERAFVAVGLLISLTELLTQNLLFLSVGLAVTLLSGYQLYQRSQGEQSLREATLADQNAITLAIDFGYSFLQAYDSLHEALKTLSKQTSQKSLRRKYQVRLQVLDIWATKRATQAVLEEAKSMKVLARNGSYY